MTLLRAITIVFLLNCAIFIKCSTAERSDDQYLASIIEHLNSKQDKIYNFNNGLFVLKKHLRTDVHVYNVTLDVNEKCTAPYPEEPCYERPLRCTATMVDDGKTVKVLDDVQCTHNPVIQPPAQIGQDGLGGMMMIEPPMRKNKIQVSHESVYSDPETIFVAERYNPQQPCLGCLFDLNVNSVGVDTLVDSALRHIESEHENKFILGRVLRLQQQVVNGVKYILVAEVVSSLCEKTSTVFDCPPNANEQPLICEIHYIEKPWISTSKHIISNNCTQSQEFTLFKNDQDNEIKVNNNEMTPSRLAELESQILLDSERNFGEMQFNGDDQLKAVEEIGEDNSRISNPLVVEELAPVVIERKRLEVKSVLPELVTADLRQDEEPSIFEDIMPDYQNDQSLTHSLSSTDPATIIETSSKRVETTSLNRKDKSSEENSSEENMKPKNRKKRSCNNDKREEDSSSSEEENKKAKCKSNSEEKNQKIVKKDDSSSSSSSSEEDDNNIKQDHKRSIGELEKISLEEKPLVKELADYAAKTLDKIDNDKDKRVVLQILGAKKLRLDGTYYSLILRMGVSQCLEEKSNTIDCLTNLHENLTKICKVQIHVGDNDDYINWKLIKSQCQNIKKDEYDRNRTNYSRYKRGVPGAPVPASVKDSQVLAFVKDTLPHLDTELKSTNKHKVLNVESVTKQVVAGLKYRIKVSFGLSECGLNDIQDVEKCNQLQGDKPKVCELVVWDRPWLNNTQYNLNCNAESIRLDFEKVARSKRQAFGAPEESSIDDPEILLFVKESLPHLDKELQTTNKHKLHNVVSVTKQVVAGISYKIKMYLTLSDCGINDVKEVENCNQLKGDEPKLCELNVWERSWLKETKYDLNCNENTIKVKFEKNGRSKRQAAVGAPVEASKDDPQILLFVKDSLPHLDKQLQSTNKHKLQNIVSVTKQVVAGVSYKIKMYLTLSDCLINDVKEVENCNELKGDAPKLCKLTVWDRSWLKQTEYKLNCNEDSIKVEFEKNGRSKRQAAVGAPVEASKDDPDILLFVKESLPHLDKELQSSKKHKIQNIVSATKQVVAGVSYKIKMNVILSECGIEESKEVETCNELKGDVPKSCKLTVWDRPWLKQTVYDLNCNENAIKIKFEKNANSRSKRQALGAPAEAPKNDPQVLLYVKESLPHLDKELQTTNKHKLHNVVSVTQQVVQGVSYKIKMYLTLSDCGINDIKEVENCNQLKGDEPKLCELNVWDRPWLKQTQYKLKCNQDTIKVEFEKSGSRSKRQIPGGAIDASKDANVYRFVVDGVTHLNSQIGATNNNYKANEIVRATKRIVAGTLYEIVVDLRDKQHPNGRECEFKIWDQPWTNFRQTNITCDDLAHSFQSNSLLAENRVTKRSVSTSSSLGNRRRYVIPGTINGKHDPSIFKHIHNALRYLDQFSQSDNKYHLKDLVDVDKQTVSGNLYRFQIQIGLSDCSKYTDMEYCEIPAENPLKLCTIKVWTREWLNSNEEYSINCDDDKEAEYNFKMSELEANKKSERKLRQSFEEYKFKFNKTYKTQSEHAYRYRIFKENLNRIDLFNKKEQGTATYGITKFADLTIEEFSKSLGLRPDLQSDENEVPFKMATIPKIDIPEAFDWRAKNAVTEVKNQGQCGSCWAFSTIGNVEGQYAIKYGKLLEFSEQELVDCDKVDQGCDGGLMDNAYRVIEKLGGLETESDYPYDADAEKCHFSKQKVVVQLSGAVNISQDEGDMAKWLVKNGPIAIAINANAMQFYVGGVSHPWKFLCSPKNLDHGVLIVGYGVYKNSFFNKTEPYWIVKNSWGSSWGEQGYYRVYRGDGTCGLNQTPSSAIVA